MLLFSIPQNQIKTMCPHNFKVVALSVTSAVAVSSADTSQGFVSVVILPFAD
jgi:hypothetical protein